MDTSWNRRLFVGALLRIPAAVVATMGGLSLRAAGAESTGKQRLTAHQSASLQRICFLLFPYAELGNPPYERIVTTFTASLDAQADTRELLVSGIDALDNAQSKTWLEFGEESQVLALKRVEAEPFFQYVLRMTKTNLFNNPTVWAYIGYEGSALEFGGYKNRGLNDIDWLDSG